MQQEVKVKTFLLPVATTAFLNQCFDMAKPAEGGAASVYTGNT